MPLAEAPRDDLLVLFSNGGSKTFLVSVLPFERATRSPIGDVGADKIFKVSPWFLELGMKFGRSATLVPTSWSAKRVEMSPAGVVTGSASNSAPEAR